MPEILVAWHRVLRISTPLGATQYCAEVNPMMHRSAW